MAEYLTLFETMTEYEEYINGEVDLPNVTYIPNNKQVLYTPVFSCDCAIYLPCVNTKGFRTDYSTIRSEYGYFPELAEVGNAIFNMYLPENPTEEDRDRLEIYIHVNDSHPNGCLSVYNGGEAPEVSVTDLSNESLFKDYLKMVIESARVSGLDDIHIRVSGMTICSQSRGINLETGEMIDYDV